MLRLLSPLFIALILSACGKQEPAATVPDFVLINARVVTMDADDTIAEAVAITGNVITSIGTSAEISQLAGPGTETIDLGGNTVSPGLIDTHNHFAWGALDARSSLDIEYPAVTSIEDIREQVRLTAVNLEPGEWVIGSKWDAGKLTDGRDMVAADLDDVTPDNPVWLLHASAHYGVANSAALEIAGIGTETPDPDGGVIVRDDDGKPTGILTDQAMSLISRVTPAVKTEDFARAISGQVTVLNQEGITTIKDPEIDQRHWDAYEAVLADGALSVRVFTLWRVPDTMAEARELLQRIAPITDPRGDECRRRADFGRRQNLH